MIQDKSASTKKFSITRSGDRIKLKRTALSQREGDESISFQVDDFDELKELFVFVDLIKPRKDNKYITRSIGEENGNVRGPNLTTLAIGEKDDRGPVVEFSAEEKNMKNIVLDQNKDDPVDSR